MGAVTSYGPRRVPRSSAISNIKEGASILGGRLRGPRFAQGRGDSCDGGSGDRHVERIYESGHVTDRATRVGPTGRHVITGIWGRCSVAQFVESNLVVDHSRCSSEPTARRVFLTALIRPRLDLTIRVMRLVLPAFATRPTLVARTKRLILANLITRAARNTRKIWKYGMTRSTSTQWVRRNASRGNRVR